MQATHHFLLVVPFSASWPRRSSEPSFQPLSVPWNGSSLEHQIVQLDDLHHKKLGGEKDISICEVSKFRQARHSCSFQAEQKYTCCSKGFHAFIDFISGDLCITVAMRDQNWG